MFYALVLVIYGVQFYFGKTHNEKVARAWVALNMPIFTTQFASIGIMNPSEESKKPSEEPSMVNAEESNVRGALIEQHSYSMFKFYATGRMNCNYCLVTLDLKRRQDMLTMLTFNLLWPEQDKVSYEIPLLFSDSFPCIFALVKKRNMKNILENDKILVKQIDITIIIERLYNSV